uniref:uncharacterized protein LOC124055792 isoform X2 n=1 Tax=Scatophagus argus TaxID=75038 RepID=UPI001ED84761|nr:uncharacterized protein LOC124055792 isoform X2 [Scatophagus argus]
MWPNKEESRGKTLQICAKINCQDLYAGLAVLARRRSDMTDRFLEIRRESGHSGNYIPSGRQLPRTPPLPDVKRHLDFSSDTDCENMEPGAAAQHDSSTFDFIVAETKTEPDDHSMLKGMTGYQLTPSDLEFIEKMQEDKIIRKLQRDLEEVQRLLQMEKMAAELVHASREKAQAELSKFPSCEELTEWVTAVLQTTSPSTELTDVDAKSLLSVVTQEDIQRAVDKKRAELARLGKMVANKRKREAEERERLEKQIVSEQLKTQRLMSQLSDLKSELAQQEAGKQKADRKSRGADESFGAGQVAPRPQTEISRLARGSSRRTTLPGSS